MRFYEAAGIDKTKVRLVIRRNAAHPCHHEAVFAIHLSGMRKTIVTIVVLGIATISYCVWPFFGLSSFLQALQRGNVAEVTARIDFDHVRRSFTDQVIRAYLHLTGKDGKLSPLSRNFVVAVAGTIADPLVERLVSPEIIMQLLETGWPASVLPERPSGTIGLNAEEIANIWQLFANSEYRVAKFYVRLPLEGRDVDRFRLRFRLSKWNWKLEAIDLPEKLQIVLAQQLLRSHPE